MSQAFYRWTNVGSKGTILGAMLLLALVAWTCTAFMGSSYGTGAGIAPVQPIPFSHQHHAGVLGIDCRYCHTSVERSSFAGIPPTKTCMNCHSQIWVGSSMLEPVRESYRTDQSIHMDASVQHARFRLFRSQHSHSKGNRLLHLSRASRPNAVHASSPKLLMKWCLDCHRDPAANIRPREKVFDMSYEPPADQRSVGEQLVKEYHVRSPESLTSCTVCHR